MTNASAQVTLAAYVQELANNEFISRNALDQCRSETGWCVVELVFDQVAQESSDSKSVATLKLVGAALNCEDELVAWQRLFDDNRQGNLEFSLCNVDTSVDEINLSIEQERRECIERMKQREAKSVQASLRKEQNKDKPKSSNTLWGARPSHPIDASSVSEMTLTCKHVRISGIVYEPDFIPTKNDSLLLRFDLETDAGAIGCECFVATKDFPMLQQSLKSGMSVRVDGVPKEHFTTKEMIVQIKWLCVEKTELLQRSDEAAPESKRVELHAHTKMSARDGITNCADLVKLAADFGHPAIAITDHGVLQSFPEAAKMHEMLKKNGVPVKILYGVEGYLVDDGIIPAHLVHEKSHLMPLVVLQTQRTPTGELQIKAKRFSPLGGNGQNINARSDETLELATLGGDNRSEAQVGLTTQRLALTLVKEFCDGCLVAAINDMADLIAIRGLAEAEGIKQQQELPLHFNPSFLELNEWLRDGDAKDAINSLFGVVNNTNADVLEFHYQKLKHLWQIANVADLLTLNDKLGRLDAVRNRQKGIQSYHIILLVRNQQGMYNLNRLVSNSHLDYFYYRPRMPRSELRYFGDGILRGAACERGEIFQHIMHTYYGVNGDFTEAIKQIEIDQTLLDLAQFYTWLEIQPLGNNRFLIDRQFGEYEFKIKDDQGLIDLNMLVIHLAKIVQKPVCATCDAHFLNADDIILRDVVLTDIGMDTSGENPTLLYFRSTAEMLAEFTYLDEAKAFEVVVTNTQAIAEQVSSEILPVPRGQFPPHIECAEERILELALDKATELYGNKSGDLPSLIQERLDKELKSIIDNGFAVMYYVAHLMVKASNDAGYLVGSRGSVGSSFVATMCGISEVNPLPSHYICPECHYFEAVLTGEYSSGYDLPSQKCPHCGTELRRDGQEIPFETFLGFFGEKQPDIDLNFAAGFREQAKQVAEDLFGSDFTFRAGTISGYADKNAIAIVRKYYEAKNKQVTMATMRSQARKLIGLKRTTGQHPGGVMVIPRTHEIYDFTAVQHPADKSSGKLITTHFDYHALHDTILKLDVLGHDDPTMLKVLHDRTGVKVENIPIPDDGVMELFHGVKSLNFKVPNRDKNRLGTIGLPEIGTQMARDMIKQTKPQRIFDLYQLSGLSHGKNVWKGNAQELIASGKCTLDDVIGCRDSIMNTLIHAGVEAQQAFAIMEQVRKGKGIKPEQETLMLEHGMPEWYIESCQKIAYMFPKSHAAAYIISALRIGWFKVHLPAYYYAAYFTVRGGAFCARKMNAPLSAITEILDDGRARYRQLKPTEADEFDLCEIIEEMMMRGIKFAPISLEQSHATEFMAISDDTILLPFVAWTGIGVLAAESIVKARADGPFRHQDDLKTRAKIGPTAISYLDDAGCLKGMIKTAQLDMFGDMG